MAATSSAVKRRRSATIWGLVVRSARPKFRPLGSGTLLNTSRWRGAGEGVRSEGGSSESIGLPLCGAGNVSERKNGRGSAAACAISSDARRPRKSVWNSPSAPPSKIRPFSFIVHFVKLKVVGSTVEFQSSHPGGTSVRSGFWVP
jgi:hypothetical protein